MALLARVGSNRSGMLENGLKPYFYVLGGFAAMCVPPSAEGARVGCADTKTWTDKDMNLKIIEKSVYILTTFAHFQDQITKYFAQDNGRRR